MPRPLSEQSIYQWSGLLSIGALLVFLAQIAMAADVSSLFQEAQATATELKKDAVTMESYARSNLSWQSHSAQIAPIREHINKAGLILSQMQSARQDAKPWHQDAIDAITPVLKQLATNTESMINHLNANPNRLKDPNYTQYLKSNAQLASDLSAAVDNIVDYDDTKTKMEELEARSGR